MIVTRLIVINDFILIPRILYTFQLTSFFFFSFKKNFLPDLFFFDFRKFCKSYYLFVFTLCMAIKEYKKVIKDTKFHFRLIF